MKKILLVMLVLPFAVFSQINVVKQNYEVTSKVTLTASNSIVLKPNTRIHYGSEFLAKIISDPYTPLLLSNENYVLSRSFQIPTKTNEIFENKDVTESVTYFDGLGRAKQSVAIKQSPNLKDIVTHIAYDGLGRQAQEFLPYASTSSGGAIKENSSLATQAYYKAHYSDDFPGITDVNLVNAYSEKQFDGSPLNRVLKQAAPGTTWDIGNGHEIEFNYNTNVNNEVALYTVSLTKNTNDPRYIAILQKEPESYAEGELHKIVTKDENHNGSTTKLHTTEEFKNKIGEVVLKRMYALIDGVETPHDTYYVYDDYGNLTYVLPPKSEATTALPTPIKLNELCYQYVYDTRNRLVEKKIPGKDWEYIIYDDLDRPVLTQDANLRIKKQWLFTKYDILGRVIYTGIYTHPTVATQPVMQSYFNTSNTKTVNPERGFYEEKLDHLGSNFYYSNTNFPNVNTNILTVNYYDNYIFNRAGAGVSVSLYEDVSKVSTSRLKGLVTGSKVRVLGTNEWITTVTYYDEKARPIRVYSHNSYLQTTDIVESKIDFVGKILKTKSTHKKTGKTDIVTVDTFEYDHGSRLLRQQQKINSQATETIVENEYDELGQLRRKKVGGNLQKVDYAYNVRGWLKNINEDTSNDNDLFNFTIRYNDTDVEVGKRLYNGNISQTSWQTENVDNTRKTYTYTYDALNRITGAIGNTNRYNLNFVNYDKNGNITSLRRQGPRNLQATIFGDMDKLVYTYDIGNKLKKVTDNTSLSYSGHYGFKDGNKSGDDYTYDANGNMLSDANKGISSITYNHLNLPQTLTVDGNNYITYIYDASGVKQAKYVIRNGLDVTNTSYAGNYIYDVTPSGEATLQFFNHSEGYIKKDGNTFNYVYQYKDHLGNVRLSYTDTNKDGVITASTEIIEESNYYPFGLKHKGYNNITSSLGNSTAQKKGFANEELEEELGKNTVAFQWRDYDPALGRFNKIDRFAEKYFTITPYHFTANNPILYQEIGGDSIGKGRKYYNKFRKEVIQKRQRILNKRARKLKRAKKKGKTKRVARLTKRYAKEDTDPNSSINTMNQTIAELDALENSDQVYNLVTSSPDVTGNQEGNITYDPNTKEVNVNVKNGYTSGLFAHELKHAYQFETGALSFGPNGNGGILYDIQDEVEAYHRGTYFGESSKTQSQIRTLYPGLRGRNRQRTLNSPSSNVPGVKTTYRKVFEIMGSRGSANAQFYIKN